MPPTDAHFQIDLPPDVARGVFANFVSVWHDQDGFTLDFASNVQPPQIGVDEQTGREAVLIQAQVVARVRIPPSQVFEIMRALEQQLTAWEKDTGQRPKGAGGDAA